MRSTGANTSTVVVSPARKKRKREQRERQEKRWKAKCGPVTVRFVEPEPRKERKKEPATKASGLDGRLGTG